MVQPSHLGNPPCGICEKPAEPFGRIWRQRFYSAVLEQYLCVNCARIYLPDAVKLAEEAEARYGGEQE